MCHLIHASIVYIDCPPASLWYVKLLLQKAAERGGYGGERYEKIEFQKRVADHYHSLRDSTWKVT